MVGPGFGLFHDCHIGGPNTIGGPGFRGCDCLDCYCAGNLPRGVPTHTVGHRN